MKMTQLLWRIVSVWLCVVAVRRYPSCHVRCLELHSEAQKPVSSQDVASVEESGETTPHEKNEQSWDLPDQSLSENENLGGDHPSELEQMTQEVEHKEREGDFEAEKAALEDELAADEGSPQMSEYSHSDTSASQHEDSAPLTPSTDSLIPPPNKDNPDNLNGQKDVPNSETSDPSDPADHEVADFDCTDDENNPYDNDSPPLVLENTSNAHTAGTKTHTDPPLTPPAVHSTKHLEANTSHTPKEQDSSSPVTTDVDPPVSSKDPEDIPTFDEWKRKMMEVEKEKTLSTHAFSNGGSHPVKKVQKNFNNYASVECGAKILGANSEAKSTSDILKENMDMYMLNPCSAKIWFIIELCEPIQVKQLDIANFELFSSTPKDFLVSISDRYPTNKWLKLGTFHARDERTVQSFPLDEHLYAKYVKMFTKYIKVELLSHYGSEHFCPLSLIRVFGTSMMAEYEEFADPSERPDDQDDDLDYPPGLSPGEAKFSKNLIGSAKDAILNMVNNIAVNVLGGSPGNLSSQEVNLTEPPQQPETTTTTETTNLTEVPDSEDVQVSPPTDTSIPETPSDTDAEDDHEQHLPVEEKTVIPLEKDEEEPISSTIILLDKEELEEDKDARDKHEQRQENLKLCSDFASRSCSCAASFQEYVQQRCSASLSKKRTCQTEDKKLNMPFIVTPTWHVPPPPSSCPKPQPPGTEVSQPSEKEASDQEPEREADLTEAAVTSGNTEGSISEPTVLEPSHTSNLFTPSVSESSLVKPTPVVETPKLSSEEPAEESEPEKSQDESAESQVEASASLSSSVSGKPSISVSADEPSAAPAEELSVDVLLTEANASVQTQEKTSVAPVLSSTSTPPSEHQSEPSDVHEIIPTPTEASPSAADTVSELQPSGPHAVITDTKTEEYAEDISPSSAGSGQLLHPSSPTAPSPSSPSLSDIYAEPFNGTEPNGNLMHGSSQKESVFMRLNNRIKALEVNMSLSGRYLEQLSQRYRKQMEEMQRAFNKTIIKLQNTSRIAEEQDLRQTESIQVLQGQLENVTQLVLNLSVRVSQLQNEVSDRQHYLLLSLVLCLCLGLLLCVHNCRITIPPGTEPELPNPKSYTYRGPESRQFSSCDETGLKRSASFPLIHADSLQLATTEGPEMLHEEETQSLGPSNRKRRRRKMKPADEVETLKPSFQAAPELCNGAAGWSGAPVSTGIPPLTKQLLQPSFRDSPSEGSSEGSSHSDDPSFCGINAACSRICDAVAQPKTRAAKRALRRRRPKPSCPVVDLLHAPRRDRNQHLPMTLRDIINRKTEQNSGTFMALTGPA